MASVFTKSLGSAMPLSPQFMNLVRSMFHVSLRRMEGARRSCPHQDRHFCVHVLTSGRIDAVVVAAMGPCEVTKVEVRCWTVRCMFQGAGLKALGEQTKPRLSSYNTRLDLISQGTISAGHFRTGSVSSGCTRRKSIVLL